jgi:hypothetical protein
VFNFPYNENEEQLGSSLNSSSTPKSTSKLLNFKLNESNASPIKSGKVNAQSSTKKRYRRKKNTGLLESDDSVNETHKSTLNTNARNVKKSKMSDSINSNDSFQKVNKRKERERKAWCWQHF